MKLKELSAFILYIVAIGIVSFFLIRLLWVGRDGFLSGEGVGVYNLIGHFLFAAPSVVLWAAATLLLYNRRLSYCYWMVLICLFLVSFLSKSHF